MKVGETCLLCLMVCRWWMQLSGRRQDDRGKMGGLVPDDQGGRVESRVILDEHVEVKQSIEGGWRRRIDKVKRKRC